MFSVTPNGPNRVDIVLDGKLDSDAMKVALDELVENTKDIKNGRMLYRIGDFHLPHARSDRNRVFSSAINVRFDQEI